MDDDNNLHFDRPDYETWILARLHYSVLRSIQDSPLWQKEDIPDIPLTEEQMISMVKSYSPDWDCRYAPYYLGGYFYITRSGFWVKKYRYKKGADDMYHIQEHYTTDKEKGRNLLMEIISYGYFQPRIFDDRIRELFVKIYRETNDTGILQYGTTSH